ncbi:hypothetical protein ACKAWT_18280 [Xanthomonas vasicola]|nr:hypothetical protein [Xanthomonas vasicola]MDO6935867.1 hypothetical protein [Xanthomonas vasicola]MDO6939768.1 hypothetical protein [Xanthomonas vasicola]MDO6949418.1 hypothetical protein [Xanthomonas vasicola]MDO6953612.1 hypothetical protein [Xanthomonas vasicola]MDO6957665.1 hypothetical protein [Xanthomonas vasicola]
MPRPRPDLRVSRRAAPRAIAQLSPDVAGHPVANGRFLLYRE